MPNIFTGLWSRFKNYIFPQAAVQRAFNVSPVLSPAMEQNIGLWYSLFVDQPPWATADIVPIGLPAAICREIARPVLVELKVDISGSARADFINDCFQRAKESFIRPLEMGLGLGGFAFKPYPHGDRILIDATSAAAFQPTKFDASGVCIGGVFREKIRSGGRYFVRLEYHDLTNTTYTIRNRAYKSDASGSVGEEVALATVAEWAEVQPEVQIENLTAPLFSYFKTPFSNTADTESPVGMSVYGGPAVELIRQVDMQWDAIRWEYKSGERKIFTDDTGANIERYSMDRLYAFGPFQASDKDFFKEFSPAFRDEPLYRGLQSILKQLEFQIGLSYGTISDPQSVEKTATEIRASKQRMYVTVDSVQKALQHTFDGLIYAMDVYASLYGLAPAGGYTVSYDWGDSILDDEDAKDKELSRDLQLLGAGVINDWEVRAKYLGEDEETAKRMLPELTQLVGSGL